MLPLHKKYMPTLKNQSRFKKINATLDIPQHFKYTSSANFSISHAQFLSPGVGINGSFCDDLDQNFQIFNH